ncbi:MAG: tRNA lysidine(34) synthetase TilS [Vicinamibacterales bacterium]
MKALQQRVRRTIRRHALCPAGTRVLAAVSGGSDSVSLVRLLLDLSGTGGFQLVALGHVHHGLRETAGRDEAFCRALAERLELPLLTRRVDVRGLAESQRLSLEDAARRLRYAALGEMADQAGADRIAVGHTEDDQAETVLLKLMRGAGTTGLAGIYPRRERVIRPLIDVARSDLRSYLRARGEHWVEDETNDDRSNPRNRVRHVVLDALGQAGGGNVRSALARAAALLREDAEWLDELAAAQMAMLATSCDDGLSLDVAGLQAAALPVRRRVVLRGLRAVAGGREVGLEHVEMVLAVLAGTARGADTPGSRVERRRGRLLLRQQGILTK